MFKVPKGITTFLYSDSTGDQLLRAHEYAIPKLAHPDPDSLFDKKLGESRKLRLRDQNLRGALNHPVIDSLFDEGVDILFLDTMHGIQGHAAYQIHQNELHMFSIYLNNNLRGNGLSLVLNKGLIERARALGVEELCEGLGGNTKSNKCYERLLAYAQEFGIEKSLRTDGNWVNIK